MSAGEKDRQSERGRKKRTSPMSEALKAIVGLKFFSTFKAKIAPPSKLISTPIKANRPAAFILLSERPALAYNNRLGRTRSRPIHPISTKVLDAGDGQTSDPERQVQEEKKV